MLGLKFGSKKFPYVDRDSTVYAALRDGASSPSDEGDFEEKNLMIRPAKREGRFWRIFVIFLLLFTNISTVFLLFATRRLGVSIDAKDPIYTPKSYSTSPKFPQTLYEILTDFSTTTAITQELPTKFTRLNWWTEYSERNFTETDALWDDINPAHGFIAMDRKWAKSQKWPDSMHLPSDDSKNVYLLEAYHLLHCVVSFLTFTINHEKLC